MLVSYGSPERSIIYFVFGGGCFGRCCLVSCYRGLLFCSYYGWCCWPDARLLWVVVSFLLYNVDACGVCVLWDYFCFCVPVVSIFRWGKFWICFIAISMALDWLSLVFVRNCCLLVLVVSCLFSGSRMRCGAGGFVAGVVLGIFYTDMGVHSRCLSIPD